MDFLVKNGFKMMISLDGDKNSNRHRVFANGKPSYETVFNNIAWLKKKYPDYFENNVFLGTVLHNLNSVEGIHDFFLKKFNKTPVISEVDTSGIDESQKEEFMKLFKNISDSLEQSRRRPEIEKNMIMRTPRTRNLLDFIHTKSGHVFKDYNNLIFPHQKKRFFPTGSCFPLRRRLFVTAKGKIFPCERVDHRHAMGYVDDKGVHIDFERIAEKYNRYFQHLASQCENCYNLVRCPLCILQMENKDGDYKCKYFKDKNSFKKSLTETMTYLEENPELYKKIMEEIFLE
jgi:uncharacterized protein